MPATSSHSDSYRVVAFWLLLLASLVAAWFVLAPLLPALLWATILAVLAAPIHDRFKKRFSETKAALLATFGTLLIIGLPVALVGLAVGVQITAFVHGSGGPTTQSVSSSDFTLDRLAIELDRLLRPLLHSFGADNFNLRQIIDQNRDVISKGIGASLSKAAFTIGFGAFTLVVSFLTMFYMLRDGHKIREPALEVLPFDRRSAEKLLSSFVETIRAVFVGIIVVAILQGSVACIAYVALGVPSPIMWGAFTIVLCAVPLVGAPVIYVPLSLMLFSQDRWIQGTILLVVGFGIVSNIDNFIRPYVIGARTSLHPIAIFFALLGGVLAFGPVGIMAGPMLLALLLALQDAVREDRRLRLASEAITPQ